MYDNYKGFILIVVGFLVVYYIHNKRNKSKDINDWRGFIGGYGSILLGIYLLYQCLILNDCN